MKKNGEQIVETAVEARAGFLGRPVLLVLIVSCALAVAFMVIVGSGFLSYSQQQGSNRSNVVAGTTLYIIDGETGLVVSSKDVGSDGTAETVDDCAAVNNCQVMKNALQADPVATGPADSRYINRAYIGDLDGRVWRFNIATDGVGNPYFTERILYSHHNMMVYYVIPL